MEAPSAGVPAAAVTAVPDAATLPWWREVTADQWRAFWAVFVGWIVDSPGMKVFGLAHCAPQSIVDAFVELRALVPRCRFRDCRHEREPDCAVRAAIAEGRVAAQRVALLQTLLAEHAAARTASREGASPRSTSMRS